MFLSVLSASPLTELEWRKRVLLVDLGKDAEFRKRVMASLKKEEKFLEERDLVVVELSEGDGDLPQCHPVSVEERKKLQKHYGMKPGESAVFVLLGKDGGIKARQTRILELEKLFLLIDRMPMRRAEMRRKSGS